ncbi:MAG TPA: acyl-CoA carboxylase subunit epsilon [Micromonosporaceae bacterium]|nr:acyl-CoA carboxylase subunit epsilon [Micromonosporaceae bacterium]
MSTSDDRAPLIRVIRGTPTPEELAALVGVVLARSRSGGTAPDAPRSAWVRSGRPGGFDLTALRGPSGWRTSALPR